MVQYTTKERYTYEDLIELMAILRSPQGCMWDRVQDHRSIRRNFLEETYEAVEAIDNDNMELLCEELGDVLLQVIFHAQMETEKGGFTMDDVADGVCKKLIFRHPHIFQDVKVESIDQANANWEALKKVEKNQTTATASLVAVARTLPALIRAEKVQSKAAKAGFEFANIQGALDKLQEEVSELACAVEGDGDAVAELGDVMFAAVKVARFLQVDPEDALESTTDRFISRFDLMEKNVLGTGENIADLSLEALTERWLQAKKEQRGEVCL